MGQSTVHWSVTRSEKIVVKDCRRAKLLV